MIGLGMTLLPSVTAHFPSRQTNHAGINKSLFDGVKLCQLNNRFQLGHLFSFEYEHDLGCAGGAHDVLVPAFGGFARSIFGIPASSCAPLLLCCSDPDVEPKRPDT